MKTKKFLGLFIFLLVAAVGFTSCSDDLDDESKKMVGKWKFSSVEVWLISDGDALGSEKMDYEKETNITFKKNGRLILEGKDENGSQLNPLEGDWELIEGKAYLTYDSNSVEEEVFVVRTLTSTTLVFEYYTKEGSYEYKNHIILGRIK